MGFTDWLLDTVGRDNIETVKRGYEGSRFKDTVDAVSDEASRFAGGLGKEYDYQMKRMAENDAKEKALQDKREMESFVEMQGYAPNQETMRSYANKRNMQALEDEGMPVGLGSANMAIRAGAVKKLAPGVVKRSTKDIVSYPAGKMSRKADRVEAQWADDMAKYDNDLVDTGRGLNALAVEIAKQKTLGLGSKAAENYAKTARSRVAPVGPADLTPNEKMALEELFARGFRR